MVKSQKEKKRRKKKTKSAGTDLPVLNKKAILDLVNKIAIPLCEDEGLELVHVEYQKESSGLVLRLYIDRHGGITLENCATVSRQLGDLLDVHFDESLPYRLEVSSPGSSRPLSSPTDYERFKGQTAKIRTVEALDGQKNFTGTLMGITDGIVSVQIDDLQRSIPFENILRGRLVNYNGE